MIKHIILVVDDNAVLLKLAKDIFELGGYTVITAQDGEQALSVLNSAKIDLVVTDILMPNIDGYLLCYKIRTTEKLKDTPIIIYTATYTSASDEALAIEIGADKFIRKPASMDVLITAAKTLLSSVGQITHKMPTRPTSLEAKRQYNEGLVQKLENKNIQLEETMIRLQSSEARLKEAQSLALIGSWEIDMISGIHHWSDEMYRLLGVEKGKITPTAKSFLSFIHPEDKEFAGRKLEEAFETSRNSFFTFRFVRTDETIWFGYSEYKFEFDKKNKPVRLYGIVQDISEKKIAEESLKNAHERLLFHIENTPLGFIEWDDQAFVKSWSKRAEEIFGWTEEDAINQHLSSYTGIYEEDMLWVVEAAKQLISGETKSNRIQHRNYTKDGNVIWCDWFNSAVRNNEGKVVTIMSMVQDITEQKVNEDITRQRLEKLVEERTHELNEALKKEKELAELKSKFVSTASHEFRTPLSSISFAAESIRNYFHQMTAEDISRKLIKIEELASHMTHLLEDILTVGKADAGKIKVMKISIDLKEFFDSLIEEVKGPLKENRVINFTFRSQHNKVSVDDKLLRNVIINLLTNALKFSLPENPVDINVAENGNDLLIEVKDHGIGIDENELVSVFEAFHRGSNVSTIPGTGLGLSILKKCVEMMGGSVTVESILKQGTTFNVSIPLK
jgi:PAS domain S-box-containing protein